MNKLKLFSVAVLSLILLFALAPVHAQWDVLPTSYDFGNVIVGESVTTTITIKNHGLAIVSVNSIAITPGSSEDFSLIYSRLPPWWIYLEPLNTEVVFTPSTEGYFSAELKIIIDRYEIVSIPLDGTGVSKQSPPEALQDIFNFFDSSVANGTLVGNGPGNSADGKLNALRNMLIETRYLLSMGNFDAACGQLSAALKRCDDFVQGTAQNKFKQMISELMNELGC